jgi:CMP-N-acetylneuraminic acid synthetase
MPNTLKHPHNTLSFWSLLPVRAGSIRLPNKTLKPLSGLPLLHYTLACMAQLKALQATHRNWVYTNDANVLNYVATFNNQINTPIDLPSFSRPDAVSHATAGAWDTVQQFLRQLQVSHSLPADQWASHLVLLQATSPFRQAEQVAQAIARYQFHLEAYQLNPNTTGLMSVTALEKPVSWLLGISPQATQSVQRLYPLNVELPMQIVRPNGAIYIVPIAPFLENTPFQLWEHLETVLPFEMPWLNSVDIDTAEEFTIAEQLFPLYRTLYQLID